MIDIEKSPFNFLQRLAYSFCAGDVLTVIIRDDGEMIWDWGGSWTVPGPDRKQTTQLINSLTGWRQGIAKDFLMYGRMIKPLPVEVMCNVPMMTGTGREIPFESVFTCNWLLPDGRKAQLSVNYLPERQTVTIDASGCKDVHIHFVPDQTTGNVSDSGKIEIAIEPLSVVMVSYR
jgi:hypothetical protein